MQLLPMYNVTNTAKPFQDFYQVHTQTLRLVEYVAYLVHKLKMKSNTFYEIGIYLFESLTIYKIILVTIIDNTT